MKNDLTDSRMSNAIVHESPRIAGTLCNGCLCLEVLTEKRRRDTREKYYCAKKRCYVLPKAIKDCKSRRMELPHVDVSLKFNRDN
jgi:hypothetical protein